MQPKPVIAGDWPFIDNVIAPLATWWRRRAMIREGLADLNAFSSAEMERIAHDVGLAPADLRTLAEHAPDEAELLDRRLATVGLDAKQLARSAATDLRDMARLCTLCGGKTRCSHDLARHPDDPGWRKYCPNEAAIVELVSDSGAH
jgi:hypothetical protein